MIKSLLQWYSQILFNDIQQVYSGRSIEDWMFMSFVSSHKNNEDYLEWKQYRDSDAYCCYAVK